MSIYLTLIYLFMTHFILIFKCQATWLYLEPIFNSEDIMQQMPAEGKKFTVVDKIWQETAYKAVCIILISKFFFNL